MGRRSKATGPKRSRSVELRLRLLAARALPVVRQILERDAVVLGGVIDVAADGADVFAGGLLPGKIVRFKT